MVLKGMRRTVFIVGTAGAGKTVLTGVLKERIESYGPSAITVNLDPAVKQLPYDPNVDVRDYVSYDEFLKSGLGPNSALIAAVDSALLHVDDIIREIDEYNADYVIIDTPGQMEVYAYRVGGQMITRALAAGNPSLVVFLIDALFFEEPLSIASALSLASSIALRLGLPQVNAVSKADLLLPEVVEEIIPRLGEEGFLEGLIERVENVNAQARLMALKLVEAIREAGFIGELIPVSSLNVETVDGLYGRIQQVLTGGDEPSAYK